MNHYKSTESDWDSDCDSSDCDNSDCDNSDCDNSAKKRKTQHLDESDWDSDSENSAKKSKTQDIVEYARESHSSESDWDSDCDSDNSAKRLKTQPNEPKELLTDDTGHIKWYTGQQIGDYIVETELGEGTFGRVMKVRDINTGQAAALKVVKNQPGQRKSVMDEVIALKVIGSRDDMKSCLCVHMISWFSCGGHICIAFPLLGSSVYDFMKDNHFQPFLLDEVQHIGHQLCAAVSFLHENHITHTDLKTENILFVNSSYTTVYCEERNLELKRLRSTNIRLGDFGNVVRDGEYHPEIIGTRYYRSPEVILRLDWNDTCDVWALGCILFELYSGKLLFPTEYDYEHLALMEAIIGKIPEEMTNASNTTYFKNGNLDFNWSNAEEHAQYNRRPLEDFRMDDSQYLDDLFYAMERMLQHEPTRRISSTEALTLPLWNDLH
ncbi:serine/threonine-protein kinase Doa-like [Bradysia coprophila]|uniref:serine/threonine-protein kinase Doa-like n=1 Tax=Bradysia coprophila TaxID=38358 RepID=UPI00187D71C6|nr:serine/threonine-protein kinase Doa-like [Bradysia coprophila]